MTQLLTDSRSHLPTESSPSIKPPCLAGMGLGLASAFLATTVTSEEVEAALWQNSQPKQPLVDYGALISADNGGPSVKVKIFSSVYDPSVNSGLLQNGGVVVSGTLGPIGTDGKRSIFSASHALYLAGANPSNITKIEVYTQDGQMRNVDMSTFRLAPGANGTLQSLDLFGANLVSDFNGIGNITLGGAAPDMTVVHSGSGFNGSLADFQSGDITRIGLGETLAWNAKVQSFISSTASDEYMNASFFGGANVPAEGLNAKVANGDSGGATLLYNSMVFSGDYRLLDYTVAGVLVGQAGFFTELGSNIYVDFGNTTAYEFGMSFVGSAGENPGGGGGTGNGAMPEPSSAALLGLAGLALTRRRRKQG